MTIQFVAQINVQHLSTQKKKKQNEFFLYLISWFQFQFLRYKVSFFCNDNTILKFAGNQSSLKLFLHALFLIFEQKESVMFIIWLYLFSLVHTPADTPTHTHMHPHIHYHVHTQLNILACNSNLLIYLFSLFLLSISKHMTNHTQLQQQQQ